MVGGTAVAVYLIVTNQDAIARHLGFNFASTVALSLVNVISTLLVHMTVVAEHWHPRQRTNVRTPIKQTLQTIHGILIIPPDHNQLACMTTLMGCVVAEKNNLMLVLHGDR